MNVETILRAKGNAVVTIAPSATIAEAVARARYRSAFHVHRRRAEAHTQPPLLGRVTDDFRPAQYPAVRSV